MRVVPGDQLRREFNRDADKWMQSLDAQLVHLQKEIEETEAVLQERAV